MGEFGIITQTGNGKDGGKCHVKVEKNSCPSLTITLKSADALKFEGVKAAAVTLKSSSKISDMYTNSEKVKCPATVSLVQTNGMFSLTAD